MTICPSHHSSRNDSLRRQAITTARYIKVTVLVRAEEGITPELAQRDVAIAIDEHIYTGRAKVSYAAIDISDQPHPLQARYIVLWRKAPPDNVLDWDQAFCFDLDEVKQVVKNITDQGVHQYRTIALGGKVTELSSEY